MSEKQLNRGNINLEVYFREELLMIVSWLVKLTNPSVELA